MKKKPTQEIINSWPDYKKIGFEKIWSFQWRPGSNKQSAVSAWGIWITNESLCNRVVHGAREYTSRMKGNPYIKGAAPWINQESWNDEIPPHKEDAPQKQTDHCECGEIATQHTGQCARCWSKEYGVIRINGSSYKADDCLRESLEKIGMGARDGETKGEYFERCRGYVLKQVSKMGMGGST
tara:strand:+ start:3055 stop:3600 length:546 start_codon:yes stop_codon:yes gene_type:complete